MPVNISDAESSFLHGRAEFNQWIDELEQILRMPDITLMLGASVMDAINAGQEDNPSVINVEKLVKKLTGRKPNYASKV